MKQETIPFGCLIVLISVLVGMGIVCWQIFKWTQIGVWLPVPLSLTLKYFGVNLDSIYTAQSWIGLAKIAKWFLKLPTSLCIPAISLSFFFLVGWVRGAKADR